MADGGAQPRKPEEVVKLEKAKSDRSTCRATGEKITKGEWRVGIEAWRAGRNTITWQKAIPFLKNCHVEVCEKANSGICKLTGYKFKKGETRFVCSTGDKKVYLTIASAASVIQPVIDAEADNFSAEQIEGLKVIPEADRGEFEEQFSAKAGQFKPKEEATKDSKVVKPAKRPRRSRKADRKRGQEHPKRRKTSTKKEAEEDESETEDESASEADIAEQEIKEEEDEDDAPVTEEAAGSGPEAGGGGGALEVDELPEYERQRMAIIARNKARMEALGLQKLAAELMPKQQPKPRTQSKGLSARKKAKPSEPQRKSLRVQGVAADDQMIDQELRNGRLVLAHRGGGSTSQPQGEGEPHEPEQLRERHPQGSVPFESDIGDEDTDKRFLELIRKAAGSTTSKGKAGKGSVQLQNLKLSEHDVAKVTANGISHIQWHPSSETLIVAAADKSGNVGMWHVDHDSASEGDDGILCFKPHNSYVSGLRWANGGKLFTASYDGSLRCLDPAAGNFELVVSAEEAEFSAFDCTPDGNVAILGDNDGYLHVFDVREKRGTQRGKEVELHNKRVNTLHFEPGNERIFASSSSDNSLSVWDLRKLGAKGGFKSLASAVHPKTCQSAFFAPDGSQRLVSLSRDDTVKVWQFDGKSSLMPEVSIRHNNNTGRWIMPFRATWSPAGDAIIVGNMKRQRERMTGWCTGSEHMDGLQVDIYTADGGDLGALRSEHMTAISSRAALHPEKKLLAASTASGRVHIFRG